MAITASMVGELRAKTDAPMMECKKALAEAAGDMSKAEEILRVRLGNKASKASARIAAEGVVAAYVSADAKTGAIVEVNCETDFVAKNENFRAFVKDITLHVAAAHPLYVSRDDVPGALIEAEREIYKGQVKGKPEAVMNKIVDGKLEKFYSTVCLLEQGFIKNPDQTIRELVSAKIAELGENIVIRRFTRYLVGEALAHDAAVAPASEAAA
jgi:elongation factor Ts